MKLRSVGAVVAGLLAIVILSTATDLALHTSGVFPPAGDPMADSLWLLATAYRVVYGIVGCFLAARLAPDRPMQHAMALGIVGVVISTAGAIATRGKGPGYGPDWFAFGLIAIALPSAWIGGRLHAIRAAGPAA
jgi:hypothetical protein